MIRWKEVAGSKPAAPIDKVLLRVAYSPQPGGFEGLFAVEKDAGSA
jgi:hypothetical protein